MKLVENIAVNSERGQSAFTRIDLLVVLLTLGILAVMLLPALARTRVKPQGTQCLYNLRQIISAWQMYADDSNGKLAPNHGAFPPNPDYAGAPIWVNGNMGGGMTQTGINDPTNSPLLVDPNYSSLGPYVKNPALYRCPSDLSTWYGQPRVRSYSMNAAVGCAFNGTRQDPGHDELGYWLEGRNGTTPGPWQTYIKNSDLIGILPPSGLFVLLDEHPDSINDASFAVSMPVSPPATYWVDVPAAYHASGCDFSFADGHVEFHNWQNPGAFPPIVWEASNAFLKVGAAVLDNQDVNWVAHHTTCLQPGVTGVYYP